MMTEAEIQVEINRELGNITSASSSLQRLIDKLDDYGSCDMFLEQINDNVESFKAELEEALAQEPDEEEDDDDDDEDWDDDDSELEEEEDE